jgi:hypothetical protein
LPDVGATGDDKREFLYDVSAMANAGGGAARPTQIVGVASHGLDAQRLMLENLLRDNIKPRIIGHRLHPIPAGNDRYVLLIRVPRSLNAPHMVDMGGTQRFYSRNSGGKYVMDVGEIRAAFLASSSLTDRAQEWGRERFDLLARGGGQARLDAGARLILHLVPLASTTPGGLLPARVLEAQASNLRPYYTPDFQQRYNLDGFLTHPPVGAGGQVPSYVQFFRTGQIESVDTALLAPSFLKGSRRLIMSQSFEQLVIEHTRSCLEAIRGAGIAPPILIGMALLDINGYVLAAPPTIGGKDESEPIEEDAMGLPPVLLDDWETPVDTVLQPLFDTLWNAFGYPESPYYDKDGRWKPRVGF